jgi:hypothetical protein
VPPQLLTTYVARQAALYWQARLCAVFGSFFRAPAFRSLTMFGLGIATLGVSTATAPAATGDVASTRLGGVITLSGRVGPLRLNVSSAVSISETLGAPAVQMTGSTTAGLPEYLGLGYDCRGPQLDECGTTYFVSQETHRFESFSTTSAAYRLPSGVHVGMSGDQAARLMRKPDIGGCLQGIGLRSPTLSLFVATKGGRTRSEPGKLVISGGRVISIGLDDRQHGVGVLFC